MWRVARHGFLFNCHWFRFRHYNDHISLFNAQPKSDGGFHLSTYPAGVEYNINVKVNFAKVRIKRIMPCINCDDLSERSSAVLKVI